MKRSGNQKKTNKRPKVSSTRWQICSDLQKSRSEQISQELEKQASEVAHLCSPDRADQWLRSQAHDQVWEAIVYVISRDGSAENFTERISELWKIQEETQYEKAIESKPDLPERLSSDFEGITYDDLPDFWEIFRVQGNFSHVSTIFRIADKCEIGGFDRWLVRYGKHMSEMIRLDPQMGYGDASELFKLCRSDLAIKIMSDSLRDGVEFLNLQANQNNLPFSHSVPYTSADCESSQDLELAASFLFCAHRLSLNQNQDILKTCANAADLLSKTQNMNGFWSNSPEDSEIDQLTTTCMVIHALAISKPRGFEQKVHKGCNWLWSTQNQAGYWGENSENPTDLTVLVLDSIELASTTHEKKISFDINAPNKKRTKKHPSPNRGRPSKFDPVDDRRIAVAFQNFKKNHSRPTYAEFAKSMQLKSPSIFLLTDKQIKAAIDRHRHRQSKQ